MIPANIDHVQIIADLNAWGLGDYKIGAICGFSQSYIGQLKCGNIHRMSYDRAARLYNFWFDEAEARKASLLQNDTVLVTST